MILLTESEEGYGDCRSDNACGADFQLAAWI